MKKMTCRAKSNFNCSLERAFKTPILGDATKTLTGYFMVPGVSHFTEDKTWGNEGGSRIPHSKKNLFSKGGPVGFDEILVRRENAYWKWKIGGFRQWMVWFSSFQGELFFSEREDKTIDVYWVYTLTSKSSLTRPFQWVFAKVIWQRNMKQAIKRMKFLAETEAPYIYS
ncbi:MAG: hypothetical protein ACI837_001836 [Crocinitomicaceae bacterium]|jgi:hypothetical protein